MVLLIEDHIRLVFVLLLALFITGFLWFFTWYQDIVFKHAQERLRDDALVIAESLWRYEPPPIAYLILSARSHSYRTVQVIDDSQKEYAAVKGPTPSFPDRLLARVGVLPVVELEEPVRYQSRTIGRIEVDWQNRAAFIYFYVIICQILLFAGLWFFLNLYLAKKTLEARVKERTADLRESQARLQSILDSMPSVLIGVDPAGNITLWNRRAEQVSGFLTEEVLDHPLEKVYPRLAPRMDQVREAIATRREKVSKKQVRMQDNRVCYEDITVFPLVANGVEGAVVRVDDITDQIRMEEMMVQSEKMLSLGGLAAGMAHEINNPLAGIIQTANVMKVRLEDIDMAANKRAASDIGICTEQVRAFMEKRGIFRMLEAINESGARVADIVDNMLSFARKSDTIVSSHDPGKLMDSILELAATDYDLKKQYDFKTIKIVKEYEKNLPMIPCEGAKVQQVILNILRNGAQAMVDAGGNQPCFILRISTEVDPGMLRMEIQDNGPGMTREVRKRIFEPFFTTKPPGVGTGLGLSVSYFIITENHRGTMGVSSAPGKGANFIIRLPLILPSPEIRETKEAGNDA
ncbi:hypothetical protein DO021_08725 [Desulfobacter hydrogenophilus]|uniref:histidine kinase n=1 Tax=Desulfobacter hydrogenophilus TaxID=2291 RepID=A0A328FCJ2_9BACT|nr:ATP-binding protein [Desulfobacter hydrogenophilus]NDY71708.1 PAS domain S-box protein [Desulfobacter hydrogenophilus]QBH13216.1 PAS domain S-box protein [Desulfobacter hydrogenophilus]RAM02361.1 hypothetical protein DO021_08725 [Desulfobacter hydrogenophilus]